MSDQVNCWEHKKCGRQPGGNKVWEFGVCPASTMEEANGFLGGHNGGRACAYVTGTFCSGTIQGTHQEKEKHCDECDFYKLLRQEHGASCTVLSFSNFIKNSKNS